MPEFDNGSVTDSLSGSRMPQHVEEHLKLVVGFIESAQENARRSLYQYSVGPFGYLPKFQHGQIGAKLADIIGELEKVRAMLAPAKEGRP